MKMYLQRLPLLLWARYVYIAALIVSLIGILPVPWFPLQLGKLVAGTSLMFVAGVLFVLGGGLGGVVGKRSSKAAWLVVCLPLAYLLSYIFSTDRSVGLLGYSVEVDTLCFVGIASIAFLLSFFLFRRLSSVRSLLWGASFAAIFAMAFQFVSIFFGTHVLPSVFANPSVNLVGKWNDLGLLVGALTLLLVLALACVPMTLAKRAGIALLTLISVLFLALVQFPLIWALLLGFCILLGSWLLIVRKQQETASVPWVPVIVGVLCVSFLLWGAAVGGGLTKVFPVSSFEVRPSFSTTLDVVRSAHGSSVKEFVFGTGPGTFSNSWFLHKPLVINQSQFWNLDFNVGYSNFTTALGTVGVLGALAWCIPVILVVLGLVRVLRRRDIFNWYEQVTAVAAACTSIYLGVSMLFYPSSEDILLLMCALAGASFAFAMKVPENQPEAEAVHKNTQRLWLVLVLLLIVALAVCGASVVRRYLVEIHVNQGVSFLSSGNIIGALNAANAALAVEKTGDSLQFAAQAGIVAMQQVVQSTSTPSAATQQQFAALAQTSIADGQQATQKNPQDYRAYLGLGRVYDVLAGVGVQGAYDQAVQQYTTAAKYNPTDPEIPLALARLHSVHGDSQATTGALKQALTLKPDYTDAILFAVQLYVADKDLNNAIVAAKAAVNSAPGVASIWFELGLLYYSNRDMQNAALALEQAVKLQTDYANAKYFLGLSYASLGKTPEAIQQFKDLAGTNPDNSEVRLILSNLEAGKQPFDGATPPVTSAPQDRTTAPISQ